MDWIYLGHAMWLVEIAGSRILFDPLLGETHHDGIFEVVPRRRIDAAALRPDLLVLTHRHPDHFDPPSLALLARLEPGAIVLTPDEMVGRACQRLGFRHVSLLEAGQHLSLPGFGLFTTPSFCPVEEWGVILASAAGTAWNQVDTELTSPDQITGILHQAAAALDRPDLVDGPDLGIVRWQPLQEIAAVTAGTIGFSGGPYRSELERVVGTRARTVIPGAAGTRHVAPHAWLNAHAYPIPEKRFLADLARRAPQIQGLPGVVGGRYQLREGRVSLLTERDLDLVTVLGGEDDRVFAPLEIPALVDPNRAGRPEAELRAVVDAWITQTLAPALGRAAIRAGLGDLRVVLEVVYPSGTQTVGMALEPGGTRVSPGFDPDHDLLNRIAGSELVAVIEGHAHWGRALLGGLLRASSRLYRITAGGLSRPGFPLIFLYTALSYAEATERWTERLVDGLS